jgi:hypothetical protein
MSAEYLLFGDYPLSDDEKEECIESLANMANYMFGPKNIARGVYDRTERVFQDFHYFRLVRKVINTESISDICIDLSLFLPESTGPPIIDEDEEGQTSYLYSGKVKEMSAMISEKRISVSHGIGVLVFNEIADLDLNVSNFTDEEPIDPSEIGGPVMFSDQLAITDVLVKIQ